MKKIIEAIKKFFDTKCMHCGESTKSYMTGYYFKHSAFGAIHCAHCNKRIG